MSMILILTDQPCALDTGTLSQLGGLGVSSVTLLEGGSAAAVLLQGWAFKGSLAEQAVDILTSGHAGARLLEPVMEVSVSPNAADPATRRTSTPRKER